MKGHHMMPHGRTEKAQMAGMADTAMSGHTNENERYAQTRRGERASKRRQSRGGKR